MENLPVLSLQGSINTNFSGVRKLFDFYHQASEYTNTVLFLDFYHLTWIDANLCAILESMVHKLSVENKVQFSADLEYINQKFNVLFRNGFINEGKEVVDERDSCVILTSFSSKDKTGFVNYISNDLLGHRGMPSFSEETKSEIIDSLIEIFNNIDLHSKSEHPFFVCGQYYPRREEIVFSMVDLGIGFLPEINRKTKKKITTDYDAIVWALQKGNTTKKSKPGGIGLNDLYNYFKKNNGNMQIISGNTYWSLDMENTVIKKYNFTSSYVGSIINLHFKC